MLPAHSHRGRNVKQRKGIRYGYSHATPVPPWCCPSAGPVLLSHQMPAILLASPWLYKWTPNSCLSCRWTTKRQKQNGKKNSRNRMWCAANRAKLPQSCLRLLQLNMFLRMPLNMLLSVQPRQLWPVYMPTMAPWQDQDELPWWEQPEYKVHQDLFLTRGPS